MFSNSSETFINVMLGWLKGFAGWVLKLFDLAGSGGNPLGWLSKHWLGLLIFFLLVGVGMDFLVWMLRWRPYWVWFRKKRIIVNDERLLKNEPFAADAVEDDDSFDRDYIVPSTMVKPVERKRKENARLEQKRRSAVVPIRRDVFTDDDFKIDKERKKSKVREDDVFDVSSLPKAKKKR